MNLRRCNKCGHEWRGISYRCKCGSYVMTLLVRCAVCHETHEYGACSVKRTSYTVYA